MIGFEGAALSESVDKEYIPHRELVDLCEAKNEQVALSICHFRQGHKTEAFDILVNHWQ
jgi:hypothetical protein